METPSRNSMEFCSIAYHEIYKSRRWLRQRHTLISVFHTAHAKYETHMFQVDIPYRWYLSMLIFKIQMLTILFFLSPWTNCIDNNIFHVMSATFPNRLFWLGQAGLWKYHVVQESILKRHSHEINKLLSITSVCVLLMPSLKNKARTKWKQSCAEIRTAMGTYEPGDKTCSLCL